MPNQPEKWYHTIELAPGVFTAGVQNHGTLQSVINAFPKLSGKSVLDLGAFDGGYSFAAERLGASRVCAIDSVAWRGEVPGFSKAGFDYAHAALKSKVEWKQVDDIPMDISPATVGMFDVVLFLGVLYHMKHPLLALERVASVTRETVLVESYYDCGDVSGPVARFYPTNEINGSDYSNWWGPNPACIQAMLEVVGFQKVETIWRGEAPFGRVLMRASK